MLDRVWLRLQQRARTKATKRRRNSRTPQAGFGVSSAQFEPMTPLARPTASRQTAAKITLGLPMPGGQMTDITELLSLARNGDGQAGDRLFAALYEELHRVAEIQLRGDPAMRATSLVHEAYLKLANHGALQVTDRAHYFAVAARAMRQIVIDQARARKAQRRGGGLELASLDSHAMQAMEHGRDEEVLALDGALENLGKLDGALARLVEMRFFGGLELGEIAALTERSERSLKRDWRRARAFLHQELAAA